MQAETDRESRRRGAREQMQFRLQLVAGWGRRVSEVLTEREREDERQEKERFETSNY